MTDTTTTEQGLEAMAEKFKAAGIAAMVDGSDVLIRLGPPSRQLQALIFESGQQYDTIMASLDEKVRDLMGSLTLYRCDGATYVFARSRDCPASQTLPNGVYLWAHDDERRFAFDPLKFEHVRGHGPELPDVVTVPADEWESLVTGVASSVVTIEPKEPEEAKEPKAKQRTYPVQPMIDRTPPILGATWWTKLAGLDRVAILVAVRMAQLAQKDKDGNWHAYASQTQLARLIGCKADTIRLAWRKLEAVGYLCKQPGTGLPGKVSVFTIFGLGFPSDRKKSS
jgi:hypothetical protein